MQSLFRQYGWFVTEPLLQLFLGLMVELVVPAVGFSGLFPEFVSAVDDLFSGGIFHFLAFKLEARPRPPGSAGKAVQATLSIMAWQTNSDFCKLFRTVARSCDAALVPWALAIRVPHLADRCFAPAHSSLAQWFLVGR